MWNDIKKKRERKLKRTSDFQYWSDRAKELIVDEESMPDVLLMEKLNFTPPSWKVWRSKLIEKLSLYTYTKKDKYSDEEITYEIIYNKKEKMWKVNYIINETLSK